MGDNLPFGHVLFIDGHEYCVFVCSTDRVQFAKQKFDKLGLAILGDDREAIHDNEGVETFLEADIVLFVEV